MVEACIDFGFFLSWLDFSRRSWAATAVCAGSRVAGAATRVMRHRDATVNPLTAVAIVLEMAATSTRSVHAGTRCRRISTHRLGGVKRTSRTGKVKVRDSHRKGVLHEARNLSSWCDRWPELLRRRHLCPDAQDGKGFDGVLACGVSQGLPGFPIRHDNRAIGPASMSTSVAPLRRRVLNDPVKVKFMPLSVLNYRHSNHSRPARSTCCHATRRGHLSRDVSYGQLRRRDLLRRPRPHGAEIAQGQLGARTQRLRRCALRRAPRPKLNLADFFRANTMKYEVIAFGTADEDCQSV